MSSSEERAGGKARRQIVTEDAFRVNPALLGLPLARPARRGLALLIDMLLVLLLASAPGFMFGIAAAYVLLRVSGRTSSGGVMRRSLRWMTRMVAALITLAVVMSIDDYLRRTPDDSESALRAEIEGVDVSLAGVAGLAASAEIIALAASPDEASARRAAGGVVERLSAAGVTDAEIARVFEALSESTDDQPWLALVADSVIQALQTRPEADGTLAGRAADDSLVATYANAVTAGDSVRADSLRGVVAVILARDSLEELESELRLTQALAADLDTELEEERARSGILRTLEIVAEDLGLGLGWSTLYFTAFVALWRGQTPGKRLLKLRIVRLDNLPIGWWAALERFGGYAAGLATGLLGFLQIYWDDNRQAVQDKIAMTVVVDEGSLHVEKQV